MRSSFSCLVPLAFLFAACGSSDSSTPADAGTNGARDAAATTDDASTMPDASIGLDASSGLDGPGVIGQVVDETGAPIANGMVLGCTIRFCLYGSSGADGRFAFDVEPPVQMIVKTPEDDTTSPRRAEGIQPLELTQRTVLDVGTVHVPLLPAGVNLGPPSADPQTVMVGDDLELTLRRADLQPPVGKRASNIAGRAVEPAMRPRFSALASEEIVAVYSLFPFATVSRSPIGVKVPSSLPMGTVVKLRTVDELDGHLSDPVEATADGSFIATPAGTGITKLSWLVISR